MLRWPADASPESNEAALSGLHHYFQAESPPGVTLIHLMNTGRLYQQTLIRNNVGSPQLSLVLPSFMLSVVAIEQRVNLEIWKYKVQTSVLMRSPTHQASSYFLFRKSTPSFAKE